MADKCKKDIIHSFVSDGLFIIPYSTPNGPVFDVIPVSDIKNINISYIG